MTAVAAQQQRQTLQRLIAMVNHSGHIRFFFLHARLTQLFRLFFNTLCDSCMHNR